MFFIVWRGWGLLVPVFAFGALMLGAVVEGSGLTFGLTKQQAIYFGEVIGSLIAGGALFFIARKIESVPGRVLVDPATNQRVVFKKSAGSFFFIPTRYWAFILPGLMVALVVVVALSPSRGRVTGIAQAPSSAASTALGAPSATHP
jgi:hypothetical protein